MTDNPLKKYSERPGTYVTLPSGGRFYKTRPRLSADGELEIRPMTAGDELKIKNPDGLMNSDGIFQVLEHIAPGIERASEIPTPDFDIIIVGMRIATYGDTMDVGAKCPKCGHDEEYQINLTNVLANATQITAPDEITIGDLKVKLRPHTAESSTILSQFQVQIARAARQFELAAVTEKEEHQKQLAEMMKRGSELIFEVASNHIVSVETPEGEIVDDPKFINEWLVELTAPEYQKIRDAVQELSTECVDRNMKIVCPQCSHDFSVEVTFDPANFFGTSSL